MRRGLPGWRRLRGLIRKESYQIIRDPSSIAIAFVLPAVLLFILGYGVSLDAKDVPLAVVVEAPSPATASLVGDFQDSQWFEPKHFDDIHAAKEALRHREVMGILWLRSNFTRELFSGGPAPIGLFLNGVDGNTARIVAGYVQGVWGSGCFAMPRAGAGTDHAVDVEQRIWFNPPRCAPPIPGSRALAVIHDPHRGATHLHGGGLGVGAGHHGGPC